MARPTTIDVNDVIEKLNQYIDKNEEPLIQEFCLNYPISNSRFYDYEKENSELSEAIKRCIKKQEVFLVRNAERNKINPVFAMFRLKQKCFGYTDKQEIDQKVSGELTYSIKDPFADDKNE